MLDFDSQSIGSQKWHLKSSSQKAPTATSVCQRQWSARPRGEINRVDRLNIFLEFRYIHGRTYAEVAVPRQEAGALGALCLPQTNLQIILEP